MGRSAITIQSGDKFGFLTVIEEVEKQEGNPNRRIRCQCDCGNMKVVFLHNLRTGSTRSCGCKDGMTVAQRLVTNIVKIPAGGSAEGECWLWQGAKSLEGYGAIAVDGFIKRAHRVAYTLKYGPIPEGLMLRHMCHNRACVNPDHVITGTAVNNRNDTVEAGRHAKAYSILTPAQIQEIRFLKNVKKLTYRELMERFGKSAESIRQALTHTYAWEKNQEKSEGIPAQLPVTETILSD